MKALAWVSENAGIRGRPQDESKRTQLFVFLKAFFFFFFFRPSPSKLREKEWGRRVTRLGYKWEDSRTRGLLTWALCKAALSRTWETPADHFSYCISTLLFFRVPEALMDQREDLGYQVPR